MATAASTLVIKTEGVTESYKDIGNLLGPLQGINTMLYQLNKAMGIVNKQNSATGKSLTTLAKEGNKTAKSQLDLQKQLRQTAKEAVKAAKEQSASSKETATSLKSLNLKAGFDMAAKAAKALAKTAATIGKYAISCLDTLYETSDEYQEQKKYVDTIRKSFDGVKIIVGKIIAQGLDRVMKNAKNPVDLMAGLFKRIALTLNDVIYYTKVVKNAIDIAAGVILTMIFKPFEIFAGKIAIVTRAMAGLPLIGDDLRKRLLQASEVAKEFALMNISGIKRDIEDIAKAEKEHAENAEKIEKTFTSSALQSAINDTEKASKKTASSTRQIKENVQATEQTLEDSHQKRMAAIQAEYASKIDAINQIAGEESIKEQMRQQALTTKLQQEQNETLNYARQTNDQLLLLKQDYYNREKMMADEAFAREAEKAEKRNQQLADEEQHWSDFAKQITDEMAHGALSTLGDSVTDLFGMALDGEEMTREGAYEMFRSMAKNIATVGLQSLLKIVGELIFQSGASAAKTPIIGPLVAAAAMATMGGIAAGLMAKYKPKKAQVSYENGGYISAGMVKGGIANQDSVIASLMPGERVLSKKEAEEYEEESNRNTVVNQYITINANGQWSTAAQFTTFVRQNLVPELNRAAAAGFAIAR